MGYTYRGSGPWGPGKGSPLTIAELDGNFYQAVQDIAEKAVQGVGIADAIIVGNQLTWVLTDHTLLGPYTLPTVNFNFRGIWLPSTAYLANDIFTEGGSTYLVLLNHTSKTTFDPNANDGSGHDYYGLLLSPPNAVLPTGGAPGAFLRKTTTADFAVAFQTAALAELNDVALLDSPAPSNGEVLTYLGGAWTNNSLPSTPPLSQLSDVAVSLPKAGQPLVYNGTKWANTNHIDLPSSLPTSTAGVLAIDRSLGEAQSLTLSENITTFSVTGWPGTGNFARLVLEIVNPASYTIAWDTVFKWPGGNVSQPTPSGRDLFVIITFDGGSNVYATAAGQDFV